MTPDYCGYLYYASQLPDCQPLSVKTWIIGGIGWIIIFALVIKWIHWCATTPVGPRYRRISHEQLWSNPEYRRNRETVMKQHGRSCAMCGSTVGVEMHHIRSRKAGGGHEISNLVPLCHYHHQYIHGRRFGRRA